MEKNNTKIENLISGGLIGAVFGAFLLKNKQEGALVGALIGAAINSTLIASEDAKKPMFRFVLKRMKSSMKYSPMAKNAL